MLRVVAVWVAVWGMAAVGLAAESHVDGVVAEVLERVARVKAAQPEAVPMAFWDFDGTIIWGDLTLGSKKVAPFFTGLMEAAVVAGLNNIYSGEAGWRRYFEDDRYRLRDLAQWLAVPFRAQMYEGKSVVEIEALAAARIRTELSRYYFLSSLRILKALQAAGVENHIISGSPEVFIRATAESLGVPRQNLHGVRVAERNGKLTAQLCYPLPVESGKIELMDAIVRAQRGGVVVAGVGNDYRADGPFLKAIATRTLPGGGKGFALMINGKHRDSAYDGLFRCVTQRELVGQGDGRPCSGNPLSSN